MDKYYVCETFVSVGGYVISHTVRHISYCKSQCKKFKGLRHRYYQGDQVFGLELKQLRMPRDFPSCVSN